jgi:hypothetical protein
MGQTNYYRSAKEVAQKLLSSDKVTDVVVIPPNAVDELSEEDDIQEETMGTIGYFYR